MQELGWLILAIFAAYGFATMMPLLRDRLPGGAASFAAWCLVPLNLACPLIIPSESIGLRSISAFVSGEIGFKMVEFLRHRRNGDPRMTLRAFHVFLIPLPVLAAVYPDHKRRLIRPENPRPQVLRLLAGSAGFILATLAISRLSRTELLRSNFLLNQAVMAIIFMIAVESLSRAICGLERLAGFDTTPIIRNAYLARTVSEFWQRYNDRIHHWLYHNVFLPAGGRRAPIRAMLLVFLVSGLFHELMFAIATSKPTGYQLAFFTIQAPAVLVSSKLESLARRGGILGKITAHAITILFLGVTSVLFFDGVSRIFPFVNASASPSR